MMKKRLLQIPRRPDRRRGPEILEKYNDQSTQDRGRYIMAGVADW